MSSRPVIPKFWTRRGGIRPCTAKPSNSPSDPTNGASNMAISDLPTWYWACRERANVDDRTGYWCNRAIHAIENNTDLYILPEHFREVKALLGSWVYGPPYNGDASHYDSLKMVACAPSAPPVPLTIMVTDVLVDCLDTLAVGRKLSVR